MTMPISAGRFLAGLCFCAAANWFPCPAAETASLVISNLSQLRPAIPPEEHRLCSVQLTGMVTATNVTGGSFFLEDDAGAVCLEVAGLRDSIQPGQAIRLEANDCVVTRTDTGFRISAEELLVNNDGEHAMKPVTAGITTDSQRVPVRLKWFNALQNRGLEVSLEGPDLPLQRIPDDFFSRPDTNSGAGLQSFMPGLDYKYYEGQWQTLPDFSRLTPVKTGVVSNFNLNICLKKDAVGLEFQGFVDFRRPGHYRLTVSSDDGSQLFLGAGNIRCQKLKHTGWPVPKWIVPGQRLDPADAGRWVEVTGLVRQVGLEGDAVYLDLGSESGRMAVTVAETVHERREILLNSRVRLQGVVQRVLNPNGEYTAGRLLVPGWRQVDILQIAADGWQRYPLSILTQLAALPEVETNNLVRVRGRVWAAVAGDRYWLEDKAGNGIWMESAHLPAAWHGRMVEALGSLVRSGTNVALADAVCRSLELAPGRGATLPVLTTIEEIRRLKAEDAGKIYPVKIRGVVNLAEFDRWGNLHDGANGINVLNLDAGNSRRAQVGDYCEIEGETRPGGFGPMIACSRRTVLGQALPPEPMHPNYEQLINGSLDGQMVEVEGGVLDQQVDAKGTTLLVSLMGGRIPVFLARAYQDPAEVHSYQDSIIRARGVVMPTFNEQHQIEMVRIFVASTRYLTVVEPPARDVFSGASKRIRELLYFDPRAAFLRRVKLAGQVVHVGRETCFLMDDRDGVRFEPQKTSAAFALGDLVEVVGYPELGTGASAPVLREALVRKTGHASLPPPKPLSAPDLFDAKNDSTLVSLEGRLVNFSVNQGRQTLEFQSGPRLLTAQLPAGMVADLPPPGSLLRLSGVYAGQGGSRLSGQKVEAFALLLNQPADIQVLARPSWWNFKHTITVIGGLGGVVVLALVWITILRRQVEERTTQLASQIQERQRIEQLHVLEEERSRVARDLHDELGSGLTEVGILGALVKNPEISAEQKSGYLDQVINVSRGLVTALDEIVWAVNPRYDTVTALGAYCSLYAQRFLELSSIRCHLELGTGLPDHPLDSKTRYALFLAFKEALNNLVRHAQASEAHLRMEVEADELRFEIADNGRGFDLTTARPGMDGLAGMQERLRKMGGECRIESRPARGTKVLFRLPLNTASTTTTGPE